MSSNYFTLYPTLNRWLGLISCIFLLPCLLLAQDAEDESAPMRVVHCTAVAQDRNIINVFINENNEKWVGTDQGVFNIYSAENGTAMKLPPRSWSPMLVNSGNDPMSVDSFGIMDTALVEGKIHLREDNYITAAYHDASDGSLWVGTSADGLYRFGSGRKPPLIEHFHEKNSRLRSNHINCIFIDQYDRYWIGTQQGVFFSEDGDKWKLYEKYDNIRAVTELGPDIWIMGDEVLWRADERNRWIPGDFDLSLAEGQIKDICFDDDGHLWIASEIITRYHIVNDKVDKFGRAEGFTSKNVTRIMADTDNALWVGTADKGLFLIEKMSKMTVSVKVAKPVTCSGGQKDASLLVSVIGGGKPPYTYNWDQPGLRGFSPGNLRPGLYTVTVTDSQKRKKVVSAKVEPPAIRVNLKKILPASKESAADGKAIATVTGETGAVKVRWDNGEQGASAQQLRPGTHRVTVTDAAGCTATSEIEMDFVPEPEPEKVEPLMVQLEQSGAINCHGQQDARLEAQVNGGKTPYRYAWSIQGHTAPFKDNIGAGDYQLTVTDAQGTTATAAVSIEEPAALAAGEAEAISKATDQRSKDGSASITPTGGTGTYQYKWDNGETSATATALAAGPHRVTVIDENNCQVVASVTIEVKPEVLDPLVVSLKEYGAIKCYADPNAELVAEVSGGKAPYDYQWSASGKTGRHIKQLTTGTYQVTVTDARGNQQTAQTDITGPERLLASAVSKRSATDQATRDGAALAAGKGGKPPYLYAWDNGETTARANKLSPGQHQVTVMDANNCEAITQVTIKKKEIPELDARTLATGQTIRLEKLYFEADSAVITSVSEPTLEEVYEFLADNPNIVVEIGGHTNNIPPHEYCDRLSTERAKAVADYVIAKGIREERISYKGYGKRKPKFSNRTAEGRRKNQRVEIKILSIQ